MRKIIKYNKFLSDVKEFSFLSKVGEDTKKDWYFGSEIAATQLVSFKDLYEKGKHAVKHF